MTTPILTNKEGELYVYHEGNKAEAVKVVNAEFLTPELFSLKPGEHLPLPEGLGVEIVDSYKLKNHSHGDVWFDFMPDWADMNWITDHRQVARIITKPVESGAGDDYPVVDFLKNAKTVAVYKKVEPIKEESQEDMAPTPIQCALEDCLLLLEEVHKDFNCLSTISLGKIEHYRKTFITGEV